MANPSISGLKLVARLSLLALPPVRPAIMAGFTRALAGSGVNICFLGQLWGQGWSCLCLERSRSHAALARARQAWPDDSGAAPRLVSSTALLTLYPRDPGAALTAAAILELAAHGISPLAMGCSHAALAVVLDQDHAAQAIEALGKAFNLPQGASPACEGIKVVQAPFAKGSS